MPRKAKKASKKSSLGPSSAPRKRLGRPPAAPKEVPPKPAPNVALPLDDKVSKLLEAEKDACSKLEAIEKGIYDYEAKYLASGVPGNVVRGYGSWLGSTTQSAPLVIREEDRIFSRSSLSGNKHLEALGGLPGVAELNQGGG